MLRISSAAVLADLKRKIRDALARRDMEALQDLRQRLILARIESVRGLELSQIISPVRERLDAMLARANKLIGEMIDAVERAIAELARTLATWFRNTLYAESARDRNETAAYWLAILGASQLRRITGAGVDAAGKIKPAPGPLPPNLTDDGMSVREILLRVSNLLVLPGDDQQNKRTPLADLVLPDFTSAANVARDVAESVPAVSKPWPAKLDYIFGELTRTATEATQMLQAGSETKQIVNRLGDGLQVAEQALIGELKHETARIRGRIDDDAAGRLPDDIYAGYTLHSRFAERTAPDHAARDGYRYFKDNRAGSAAAWSARIIPPYRKNCLCFTIPILETPEGETYDAEFGIRVSGTQVISIRDVGTWQTWFDSQPPWVAKKLIGERRWFAAASTGNGRPTWADFVTPKGKIMPVRRLLDESQIERFRRKERVKIIIEEQSRRHFEAWERGDGRFDSSPELEAEYRRRLDVFLRRWLK